MLDPAADAAHVAGIFLERPQARVLFRRRRGVVVVGPGAADAFDDLFQLEVVCARQLQVSPQS